MKKIIIFSAFVLIGAAAFSRQALAAAYEAIANPKEVASTLNHLVERAIDGQKGFEEAAQHASSADLKARFLAKSAERAKFAGELQTKVQELGREAENEGTVAGAAHRAWIDMKTAVTKNDDKTVLEAVKMEENKALEDYRDALKKDLPSNIRKVIQKQSEKIESSYEWAAKKAEEQKRK